MKQPPSERGVPTEVAALAAEIGRILDLQRPLVFLDLEATGLDLQTDRIVEVAMVRVDPDGTSHAYTRTVDPERPVPAEAAAVHGLTNEDLDGAPRFVDLASGILEFIAGADLAGYNHGRYDLPLLRAEFERAGFDFDWRAHRIVDVSVIFRRMEPRSLSGAMRFYCDRELTDAHAAAADVAATMAVLIGQAQRYPDLDRDADALDAFTRPRDPEADRSAR
ncbi:MAG: 3'-5' exonuclease [Acidobacteria bacterium]|nr:3'-5' exonuclease [Acidobacteriota bacterium]